MSIEERPDTPPLTRRQLRELRNTGATPIVTESAPVAPPVAPPPRAAEPVEIAPAPDIDPDAVPLTRRQARLIERVRTASVPVITAEVAAAEAERRAAEEAERQDADEAGPEEPAAVDEAAEPEADVDVDIDVDVEEIGVEGVGDEGTGDDESGDDAVGEAGPADAEPLEGDEDHGLAESHEHESVDGEGPADEGAGGEPEDDRDETGLRTDAASLWAAPVAATDVVAVDGEVELVPGADDAGPVEPDVDENPRPIVAEVFGVELLSGEGVDMELPASFDELLTRDSTMTGSASAPSALILSQSPDTSTFDSPIAATGEVLITGTLAFPESFGSTGVVPGSADGEEVDALLVDREIPAASSPTPIAASSAVSTLKSADEIIQPPAPERGNRLMMVLAITAGALALALVGVLILGVVSGIFG